MPECNMLVFQAEVEKNTQHIYGLRIELASRLKKLERKKRGGKSCVVQKSFYSTLLVPYTIAIK